VRQLPGKRVQSVLSPFVSGIYFNVARPALRDRKVRQALRFATDRSLVFDKIYHRSGIITESVVAHVSSDADESLALTPFNLARAQALLGAAGWERRSDGTRWKDGEQLSLRLAIPAGYPPSAATAEILRQGWSQLGLRVDLHAYDAGKYFAPYGAGGILQTGNFDAALLSVSSPDSADVTNFYGCAYAPPHGFNFMHYCNPNVDAALEKYVNTYDAVPRFQAARSFQRAIDEDAPVIVLYERANVCAYDENLTGFHPQAVGFFDDVMNLDI
jgi:peptide/nickel transport system substrate-binding protein